MKKYFDLVALVRRIFVPLCSKLLIQSGLGVVFIFLCRYSELEVEPCGCTKWGPLPIMSRVSNQDNKRS